MVGISDYRPVDVPTGTVELRVHGVSGTPPEALIKQTSVLVAGTATAGFYRNAPMGEPLSARAKGVREGYAWGGLTSGTRITSALRLLLLPFSFVNVAGWMVPGVRDADGAPTHPKDPQALSGRVAGHALASRLLAVCLTAFMTMGALWIVLGGVKYAPSRFGFTFLAGEKAQALASLALVIALVGIWTWVARRRASMPEAGATSGAAAQRVSREPVISAADDAFDVSRLWQVSDTTKRLSGIHAAIAVAGAVLVTDYGLRGASALAASGTVAAWVALVAGVVGIVALSIRGVAGRRLSRLVRWFALPFALLSAALTFFAPRPSPASVIAQSEKAMVGAAAAVAVAVLVLVLAQWLVGPRGGPPAGRLYAGAFTVIGFGTALTGVVGVAVLSTYWLSGGTAVAVNPVLGSMAEAIAIVGLVAVCVFLIVALLQLNVTKGPDGVARFTRLRSTVANARGAIVAGAFVFAIGANATIAAALWAAWKPKQPGLAGPLGAMTHSTGWATFGWVVVAAVVGAVFAARLASVWARIVATLGIALVILAAGWAAGAGWAAWVAHRAVAGVNDAIATDSDGWFVRAAIIGACVTPAAAVIAYIGWGSRDQGLRRGVGIIWDLVDFWPRQFHPWAPPPYTDTTIPELSDRVSALVREADGVHVVVSAHSQGAIIAVPALSRLFALGGLTRDEASRVCLLTYGQLLDAHYRWLFPWIFNPTLFRQVDDALAGHWVNLYRSTDPLGQPVGVLDQQNPSRNISITEDLVMPTGSTTKAKTLNHGDYWYSQPQYPNALFGLVVRED